MTFYSFFKPEKHRLDIVIDPDHAIDETDENNNYFQVDIVIPEPASQLHMGHKMKKGESLYSPNGKFYLIFQTSGNLVLFKKLPKKDIVIWNSGTSGTDATEVYMDYGGCLKAKLLRESSILAAVLMAHMKMMSSD